MRVFVSRSGVVDHIRRTLSRRALVEVEALALDVPGQRRVIRIGIGAIALSHAAGADCERNMQEDGQVPLGKEFVTVKEHPLHDHDGPVRHPNRVILHGAVRAEANARVTIAWLPPGRKGSRTLAVKAPRS